MNWDSKLHHTFMRSSVSTRGYHHLPIGRRTWEIGTHTDKADSADILKGTLQNERRKRRPSMLYGSVKGKTCGKRCSALQGRMQCSARADAVHCKGGCSALRLRWAKTGTEIVSPFSGYLHRNNTGLTHVHYIYVQLSEESSWLSRNLVGIGI